MEDVTSASQCSPTTACDDIASDDDDDENADDDGDGDDGCEDHDHDEYDDDGGLTQLVLILTSHGL